MEEQRIETWRDGLNPEQERAATHPRGPLLIVAGAGTGKTKTLA
ncbi:MAG: UvrD-helicase domain-containing protein, partial [Actinomycetota bacterium]